MKKLALSLILSLLLPLPSFAAQNDIFGKMPDFSATMIMNSGGLIQPMKFYYTKKKQRAEPTGESLGQMVIITRLDKDLVWILMPAQKSFMEMPLSKQQVNPLTQTRAVTDTEKIGNETIDGHPCLKEKVAVTEADGSTLKMYVWDATDIGWPIQAEALDGSWCYSFTNIKINEQDPSLFEMPGGYERMEGFGVPSARDAAPAQEMPSIPIPSVPDE